jgi:tRNA A-37 threonylcarbamoyl transferase component Bud32
VIEMTADHPDLEELQAYGQGRLAPEAARALEEHLTACETCCDLVDQAPGDSFAGRLRDAGPDTHRRPGQGTNTDLTGATLADVPAIPPELIAHPRYRVLGLIGQGGMGAVYRAEHLHMDRQVALKVINPGLMRHPTAVQRFQQEVRAAARLHHPNIVHAYDADQAGGLHFLVMEYVEGTSLADLVRERGPLPVAEACACARQAALGLQHAHEQGMVHRDVKPHNLMRTPAGQVKMLDFGLARLPRSPDVPPAGDGTAGLLTGSGVVMGTADYIAPEQAVDPRAADIRADVYSLGCTLFHLLTGRPPFPDGTIPEKLAHHAGTPLPAVSELRPEVSAALAAVLERMTAKDPTGRQATPAEVAEALAPFCPPEEVRSPVVPGRRRWLAAVLVLLAAGLAGLGALVLRLGHDRDEVGGPTGGKEPDLAVREDPGPKVPESEEQAVRAVQQLGGKISRDDKLPGKPVVSVSLAHTKAADADLRALAAFPQLRTLELQGTKVTDAGMKYVGELKDLQSLDLLFAPVGDAGIKRLAGLTRLQMLTLSGRKVTDAGMRDLEKLRNLHHLALHDTAITDEGMKSLAGLAAMDNLSLISARGVGDEGMKSVARMKRLRLLDVFETRVADEGLKELAGLPRLFSLKLGKTRVTDAGIRALAGAAELRWLDLSDTDVTDEGLKELVRHPRLSNLNLQGARKVTDAGMRELARLPQLKHLLLGWTQVTDAGLEDLARCSQLTHLTLTGTEVTDAGIQKLGRCTRLMSLHLGSVKKVTEAGVAELRKVLPSLAVHR